MRELTPAQTVLLQFVAEGRVQHFERDGVVPVHTIAVNRIVTEIARRLVRHGFADYPEPDAHDRRMATTEQGIDALLRARPEHRWPAGMPR